MEKQNEKESQRKNEPEKYGKLNKERKERKEKQGKGKEDKEKYKKIDMQKKDRKIGRHGNK